MKFTIHTINYAYSGISRYTFLEMLLSALKDNGNFDTWFEGNTCNYKQWWHFRDLNTAFVASANNLEEIEDLLKEIEKYKKENIK